ncbi:MAG: hypothetical protein QGG40_03665, partial [Myxococcota bacterium]|nr:hypothetical protein [Myxococcota bacterium]
MWVESSVPGARLTDLLPLDPLEVDYLVLELRRLMETLHGMGTVHGHLAVDRVLVDTQGRPSMVGVGLVTSSFEDDLLALTSMVKKTKGVVETRQAMSDALAREAQEALM